MKFFSEYTKMSVQLDVVKVFALLMIIVNMSFGVLFFIQASNVRTIIIPPSFTSKFEVVGNRLDNKYFEEVGNYLSQSILTTSPGTVGNSFNAIENFISKDPDVIKVTKEYFIEQNKVIKENNIYQAFYPLKTLPNHKNNSFTVEGLLKSMTGNVMIEEKKAQITFDYKVTNKKLVIKKFEVRK